MKQLPLLALSAFHVVVKAGGVRAAARELGIAHSSVSRRISELEKRLGCQLLEPKATPHSPLLLSEKGRALASSVQHAFALLDAELDHGPSRKVSRAITVSTTDSFATRWLLPRLPRFREAHPHSKISVAVSSDVLDLNRASVDVALRMGSGPWPGATSWMDDVLVPVTSPRLMAARKRLPLKALLDFSLLHEGDPSASWDRWRDEMGPTELATNVGEAFHSSHLVIEAALQGFGIALARARLVQRELESGLLVMPFGRYSLRLPQAYWIVTKPGSVPTQTIRRFIDWLKQEAQIPWLLETI